MKTKNLKFFGAAIAILLTVGAAMSFSLPKKEAVTSVYYYVSDDMSEGAYRTISHWSTSNDATPCGGIAVRPCKVIVPSGSSLNSILGSKTNAQVLQISDGFKDEP